VALLSVAGFFAVMSRFLLGGREYPEGKRASFLRGIPLTVDVPARSAMVDDGA